VGKQKLLHKLVSKSLIYYKKRFHQPANSQQQKIWRYWELLNVLVSRNLKVRYRGSLLGVYWSLLNPLIMTGLYTAIFGAAFASYYHNSVANYILAAFTGLVVMNFFSASTSQALTSIVGNGAILNKIQLPISIFPVSLIAANVFQFVVGVLPLLAIITLIKSSSIVNLLALLVPCTALVLVCTGIGFLVSALYVFFRDLPYFYELVVFMLLLSSPVFYPADIVPKQIKPFLSLNPLSPIIESLRQITLEQTPPDLNLIWGSLLTSIVVMTFGWTVFHLWRHKFMDLL
jgi:ABC-type polysaccharide/polyol phosphate export permease